MPTNRKKNTKRPLTKFALRYGRYRNKERPDVAALFYHYKSSLTPVSPYRANESVNRRQWKLAISQYQYHIAYGFPMDWIRGLRAYAPTAHDDFASEWTRVELQNPIHPLFELTHWERLDECLMNYPPPLIGDGFPGYMVAQNPVVWDVLRPILQLASCYLDNAHLWPWWDALLSEANSDNKVTQPHQNDGDPDTLHFRLRNAEEVAKQAVPVRDLLTEMAGGWVFRIRDGRRSPGDGGKQQSGWYGATAALAAAWKTGSITLTADIIKALLHRKLTEPERVMATNLLARTLVHETAHATFKHYQNRIDPRPNSRPKFNLEPYFQDEGLNELGNSMEQNVMKTNTAPILPVGCGQPLMIVNIDFPFPHQHRSNAGHKEYLPREREFETQAQLRSLMSIEWMRMLLLPQFWSLHVGRFGGDAITQNNHLAQRAIIWHKEVPVLGTQLITNLNAAISPNEEIPPEMPPRDKIVLKIKNERRDMQRRARDRLRLALTKYRDGKDEAFNPVMPKPPSYQETGGPYAAGGPQALYTPKAPVAPQEPGGVQASGDLSTPTSVYVPSSDEDGEPIQPAQVHEVRRIVIFINYFRNILGLHCVATCPQDALWFHLNRLVTSLGEPCIDTKSWIRFLKACNKAVQMLSWDPKMMIIRSLKNGWQPDPSRPPLAAIPCPNPISEGDQLEKHLKFVRRYIWSWAFYSRTRSMTWFDEDVVSWAYHFAGGPEITAEEFKSICIHHFTTCWTTGPPGCLQWNAPDYLHGMLRHVYKEAKAISEYSDVGTWLPTEEIKDLCNKAINGVLEDERVDVPRYLPGDDDKEWWMRAVLELLPDFFSVASVRHNGEPVIFFSYKNTMTREELLEVVTEQQVDALRKFIQDYTDIPGYRKAMWPREFRELYNASQEDNELRIALPRVFLTLIQFSYNDLCYLAHDRRVIFMAVPFDSDDDDSFSDSN